MLIKGKRAIVVGGASGLGKATVQMLVERGARVVILDLPSSEGRTVAGDLGGNATFAGCDIADHIGTESAVHGAAAFLGGLDIGVNIAGGGAPARRVTNANGPYPLDIFRRVVDTNLTSSFNLARLEAFHMSQSPGDETTERGIIINMSSNTAYGGPVGLVPYSAAKAGVAALSLTMARDLAPYGIRVMAIAPSMFDTNLLKILKSDDKNELLTDSVFPKRMGQPNEFAQLVQMIIENPMLNGDTIRLDAGTHRPLRDTLEDQLF